MLVRHLRPLVALACAAVLLIGCGEAVGGGKGSVSVAITKDFGAQPVVSAPPVGVNGSTSLLEVLDRVTDTREGTRSITSIGGVDGAWRLWVNGVRVGNAGKAKVRPGDRVWLDLPGAGVTASVPAVTGSFPEPFVHGIGGKRLPVRVECATPGSEPCKEVSKRLASYDVPVAIGGLLTAHVEETLRILVGPWTALAADHTIDELEKGPAASGVYARIARDGRTITALDPGGRTARRLGAGTGLVAATAVGDDRPTWVVTGTDDAGVASAARAFEEGTLDNRFALAVSDDLPVPLPVAGGSG